MIQFSTIAAKLPHGAVRPALLAGASPASFALTLGATRLVDPAAPPEATAILLPQRQADAEPGKFLPAPPEGETREQDAGPDAGAPAYAWFALAQPVEPTPEPVVAASIAEPPLAIEARPVALQPEAPALPTPPVAQEAQAPGPEAPAIPVPLARRAVEIAGAPAAPQILAAPMPAQAPQAVTATPPAPAASDPPSQDPALAAAISAPTPVAAAPQAAATPPAATPPADVPPAAKPTAPIAAEPRQAQPPAAIAPAPAPEPAPVAEPLVRAAAIEQVFTLVAEQPRALRREAATDIAQPGAAAPAEAPRIPVAATAQTGDAMLDLRRREWTGQMIDQIEALRDAAPVRETRIRLAPESLGTVDVSIRHEGERVHVHFATETPAARQALADAQPRLAEIAEARGLKLGQTSVDTGTGSGAGQGSTPQHRAETPRAPVPSRPARAQADTADTDDRIA